MNSNKTMRICEKEVLTGYPYRPDSAYMTELVGRDEEMKSITAAWMAGTRKLPLSPLLLGEPGVGKNRLVYELARRTGKDLYIFQGHEDVTAEDLACAVRFSEDPDKKMDYVLSPLVTAMVRGQICFIDEIAKIRPRALALLVSVLDERRYIDSTLLGERIFAQNGFRFIAATNTADLAGNTIPEFIGQRMRPAIQIGYPSQEVVNRILQTQFPQIGQGTATLTDLFWRLWRRRNPKCPPTVRDAIQIFNFTIGMESFGQIQVQESFENSDIDHPFPLYAQENQFPVPPELMTRAFDLFFDGPEQG